MQPVGIIFIVCSSLIFLVSHGLPQFPKPPPPPNSSGIVKNLPPPPPPPPPRNNGVSNLRQRISDRMSGKLKEPARGANSRSKMGNAELVRRSAANQARVKKQAQARRRLEQRAAAMRAAKNRQKSTHKNKGRKANKGKTRRSAGPPTVRKNRGRIPMNRGRRPLFKRKRRNRGKKSQQKNRKPLRKGAKAVMNKGRFSSKGPLRQNRRNSNGRKQPSSLLGGGGKNPTGKSSVKSGKFQPSPKTAGKLSKKAKDVVDFQDRLDRMNQIDMEDLDDSNDFHRLFTTAVEKMIGHAIQREQRRKERQKKKNKQRRRSNKNNKNTKIKNNNAVRRQSRSLRVKRQLKRSGVKDFSLKNLPKKIQKAMKGIRLKVISETTDRLGNKHYRLGLQFKGVKVIGTGLQYSKIKAKKVKLRPFPSGSFLDRKKKNRGQTERSKTKTIKKEAPIRGGFVSGINFTMPDRADIDMKGLQSQFQNNLKDKIKKNKPNFEFDGKRTMQRLVLFVDEEAEQPVRLAIETSMYGEKPDRGGAERPYAILDAKTGEVIKEFNALTSEQTGAGYGGNEKIGQRKYGENEDLGLRLIEEDGVCIYETDNIVTYKLSGTNANEDEPYSIDCGAEEKDEVNGAYAPINDAHYNLDAAVQFMIDRYDNPPMGDDLVEVRVQGPDEDNAIWNGEAILLYNGVNKFYPLTSADVTAHELAHGIIEYNSELEYEKESGGMNEAFADITGKTAQVYISGNADNFDWKIGADILKEEGKAMRYMDDPTKDGKSIDNYKDYTDDTDVHYSSGIMNKAFQLIADSDSFSIFEAYDMFYIANLYQWRSTTGFLKGAAGALRTMCELKEGKYIEYDYDHIVIQEAVDAFKQVGISCENSSSCKYSCEKA